jgi:hypothetical protein
VAAINKTGVEGVVLIQSFEQGTGEYPTIRRLSNWIPVSLEAPIFPLSQIEEQNNIFN